MLLASVAVFVVCNAIFKTKKYIHNFVNIDKLSLQIKNKQKDLETCIDHDPACVHLVRKKGRDHCTFPSRVTILILKQVSLSTKL